MENQTSATKVADGSSRRFLWRLLYGVTINVAIWGGLLFGPAGTLDWWRGWVALGVIVLAAITSMLVVFRRQPDLLDERMKPLWQRGQPLVDKVLITITVAEFVGLLVSIPLDVFHWHLLPRPGIVLSSLGMVFFIAGWWIVALAFQANRFAAPVVKHQAERGQFVVDTGAYAVVRHPMYAGMGLLLVGLPLWLQSYAGALLSLVVMLTLAVRIHFEEQFLRRELPGYEAYTQRVRYRLIPFFW